MDQENTYYKKSIESSQGADDSKFQLLQDRIDAYANELRQAELRIRKEVTRNEVMIRDHFDEKKRLDAELLSTQTQL